VTDGGGADLAGVKRAAAAIDLAAVARRLGRHVAARFAPVPLHRRD
jgi:hypothetical protein